MKSSSRDEAAVRTWNWLKLANLDTTRTLRIPVPCNHTWIPYIIIIPRLYVRYNNQNISAGTGTGPFHPQSTVSCSNNTNPFEYVHVNVHKTDLWFRNLSHKMTWDYLGIYNNCIAYECKIVFVSVSDQF
jgi:hypothetical protein